jgi:hypothetical protein
VWTVPNIALLWSQEQARRSGFLCVTARRIRGFVLFRVDSWIVFLRDQRRSTNSHELIQNKTSEDLELRPVLPRRGTDCDSRETIFDSLKNEAFV